MLRGAAVARLDALMVGERVFCAEPRLHGEEAFYDVPFAITEGVEDYAVGVKVVIHAVAAAQSVENHAPCAERNFKSEVGFDVFARPKRNLVAVAVFLHVLTVGKLHLARLEVDVVELHAEVDFLALGGGDGDVFAEHLMLQVSVETLFHLQYVHRLGEVVLAVNEGCLGRERPAEIVLVVNGCGGVAPMDFGDVVAHVHIVPATEKHHVESAVFGRLDGDFAVDVIKIENLVLVLLGGLEEYLEVGAPCRKEERSLVLDDGAVEGEFGREQADGGVESKMLHVAAACLDVEHRRGSVTKLRRNRTFIKRRIGERLVVEGGEHSHEVSRVVDDGVVDEDEVLCSRAAAHLEAAGAVALRLDARQELDRLDDVPLAHQRGHFRHL